MRTIRILALASAALAATPAMAQDMIDDAPFTGVYVGGSVSFDAQPNDVGESVVFDRNGDGIFADPVNTATGGNAFAPGFCNGTANGATPGSGCRNDKDNIGYSARVGADHQFGNIVVGVVGEFGRSEIRDSVSAFSNTPAQYVLTREIDWEANIRGRLGYAANTTLFYGTTGVGYAKIDNRFSSPTNTLNAFSDNGNHREWGFVAGGGVEQKIGRNFSIGLEYMFHRYEDRDYVVTASRGTAPATQPFVAAPFATTDMKRSFDYFRWHSLKATAAFRF